MRHATIAVSLSLLPCICMLPAQNTSLLGQWREPLGSVLRVESCSTGVCIRIVSVPASAPSMLDDHNPDPAQQRRVLCNLQIGSGFHLEDMTHATGGSLYDPKSGHTYHGLMTLDGDGLKLRGYVGAPIFGRTQIWKRSSEHVPPCPAR